MSLTASWLCFTPRQFTRGRDYEVIGAGGLAPQMSSAFAILAEGALRAHGAGVDPVWQFGSLSPDGPAVLARCAFEEREGARARVIWALALPLEYLRSSGFALYAYVERFVAVPPAAGSMPLAVELKEQRVASLAVDLITLLAKYIEAGTVRVAVTEVQQALRLFCQLVELLPPGDRTRVSFSTAPADARTFEVDPSAPNVDAITVGDEARAVANLWSIFRYGVTQPVQSELSLTRNPVDWICSLLAAEDLAGKFRGLSKLIVERLAATQHATAFAMLRRALELQLMRTDAKRAAATLVTLEEQGHLSAEYGTPPIWIARLVVELNLMAHLPAALLKKVLRPGSLTFLLNLLQRPSSVTRLQGWVAALQRPSSHDAATKRELLRACREGWGDLLGPRRRQFVQGDLARTVALLALYEHCRGKRQTKRTGGRS
jgi:hypothetical protein